MHDSQRGSRMLKSERVSVLPYTYISHICIVQFMFRFGSKVASRQMRPETLVGPLVKCPLHLPIVTKIHKCGRNLIERTKAKFRENPWSSCRVVICRYADRHGQSNVCNVCCLLLRTRQRRSVNCLSPCTVWY